MPKGFIILATAAAATLGSVVVATPASAQYHHDRGYHRGWHGDRHGHWRHERERHWHHHYRGYYGHHYRGW